MRLCRFEINGAIQVGFYDERGVIPSGGPPKPMPRRSPRGLPS